MTKRAKAHNPERVFIGRNNPYPKEPVVIPDYEQLTPEDDLPVFGNESPKTVSEEIMQRQPVIKEERTMAKAEGLKKSKEKGKEVWGKNFPKLPAFQEGRGRLDSGVLDDHYAKMLAIGQEGLKTFFRDNAGLSGVQLRQVDSKEQLKAYRESLPAGMDGAEKAQVWQALQMASQEIFLKKELRDAEKIPPRHAWQFAKQLNDTMKLRMLSEYLRELTTVKTEVSANYVKRLMLEYEIRREYEQPTKQDESKKKKLTPQDILASVARYDLSAITSMEDIEFMAMVNDLSIEQCKQLKDGIDRVKEWINKGIMGKSDYLDFKLSRKTS